MSDLPDSVADVKLSPSEDYWRKLAGHVTHRNAAGCPWSVQTYVAVLVGPHEISACVPRYSMTDSTTDWALTAVTDDGRLIVLAMTFNASHHDLEGEQIAERQRTPATFVVHEASVRRLADVSRLDIERVAGRPDGFGQLSRRELNLGGISLTFRDKLVVQLGIDQIGLYDDDDLARTDALLDAVREHTGL